MRFINRAEELKSLNAKWKENKPHFVIIYGKRRVGKTELIKQFIKDKPSIYFLADKRTELEQLKELGRIMGDFFKDSLLKDRGFTEWIEVFKYFDEVSRKIKESFNILESNVYEKVSIELLWGFREKIFPFERVGRWWDKDNELDMVALNAADKEILFGEVKWSNKPLGTNIFEELKRKSESVDWHNATRKVHYLLCSKSGFTKDMLDLAKKEKVLLIHKDKLLMP